MLSMGKALGLIVLIVTASWLGAFVSVGKHLGQSVLIVAARLGVVAVADVELLPLSPQAVRNIANKTTTTFSAIVFMEKY